MSQNLVLFTTFELLAFCIILYAIIRANIFVNSLQKEVNELHIYLPVTIRDIKMDLKAFNESLAKKFEKKALTKQELGFLAGKIFSDIIFSRFNSSPLKKNMVITSVIIRLWKIRERLNVTFLKFFLK